MQIIQEEAAAEGQEGAEDKLQPQKAATPVDAPQTDLAEDVETYCKGWDWKPENPMNNRKGAGGRPAAKFTSQAIEFLESGICTDLLVVTWRIWISPHLQRIVSKPPVYKSCS